MNHYKATRKMRNGSNEFQRNIGDSGGRSRERERDISNVKKKTTLEQTLPVIPFSESKGFSLGKVPI